MMTETTPTDPPPTDSLEQPSPAVGSHCTIPPSNPPSEKPAGEIIDLVGTSCYISRPTSPSRTGTILLLLLTNGTGHLTPTNQLQADHFASRGYLVLMPDLFAGDPAPSTANLPPSLPSDAGILDHIGYHAFEAAKGFKIDMWLARHTPENTLPRIKTVLGAVRERYGDKEYTPALGTAVVGYCFGGKYALLLAGAEGEGFGVTACAVAHGTLVTVDDLKGVEKPLCLAAVEGDPYFTEETMEEGVKALREGGGEVEVKLWKGVPHGFAVYGSFEEEELKEKQKEVEKEFMEFLDRY